LGCFLLCNDLEEDDDVVREKPVNAADFTFIF